MPVYFGFPNNRAQTVSDSLNARGINLLRARPSEITTHCHNEVTQPAFSSYASNLPAFMKAQQTRVVQPLRTEAFPIDFPAEKLLPLRLPDLIVDFPKPLPQDRLDILGKVGYSQVTIQKSSMLVFRAPAIKTIKLLIEYGANKVNRTTQNTVNLSSLSTTILILKIFSSFLTTHTYPAFSDSDHAIPYEDFPKVFEKDNSNKRKRTVDDVGDNPHIQTSSGGPDEMQVDIVVPPIQLTDRIILHKAKPGTEQKICWGGPHEIPLTSGILFPYVPQLANDDKNMVPYVINRYFFKALGHSFAQCIGNFDKVKSAWGNLVTTDVGNVLSHLAKVIDIGLGCQSRVFPIFDGGVYQGCFLSGARFSLCVLGTVYRPISTDAIKLEMVDVKFHTSVLNMIAGLAGDDEQVKSCESMRQLSNRLRELELSESTKDAIKKEIVHLNFSSNYLAVNSTTIIQCIRLMGDTSTQIDNDFPMHPSHIFSSDRVGSVLSAFGYQAPTFLIPSCPTSKLVAGNDPPKTFVCRLVSLSSAIADWKLVMKQKSITNNPANLSKSFQDRSFGSGEKKMIWQELCELVNAQAKASDDLLGNLEKSLAASVVGGETDVFDL